MQDIKTLECNIEILREKLNKLIVENDFKLVNKEVVELSQQLDVLLDVYLKIEKNLLAT